MEHDILPLAFPPLSLIIYLTACSVARNACLGPTANISELLDSLSTTTTMTTHLLNR